MKENYFKFFAVFFTCFSALLYAGNPSGKHGPIIGPGPGEEFFEIQLSKLNLSKEQKKKTDALRESGKREMHEIMSTLKTLIWDLQDEIKKENSDTSKINSITDKICETEKRLMRKRTSDIIQLKSILTKEQFSQLMENLEKKDFRKKKNMFQKITGN